jgi:heptosyltransferase-2
VKEILVIQTAFIGDVVLALPVAQALHAQHPQARIHMLVRGGNEALLHNHPAIHRVWVWDKRKDKYRNLLHLIGQLRRTRFDLVVNCQRFFSTGFVTACLRATHKTGFANATLAAFYTEKHPHTVGTIADADYPHEVDRNLGLIQNFVSPGRVLPKLYPSPADAEKVRAIVGAVKKYIVLAPASVWFTKQWPAEKWAVLIALIPKDYTKFLVGAPTDAALCEGLAADRTDVVNLAGKLSFLQTVALMQGARRTFANDSAPLHFATAAGCPTTALFLNTVPQFGFGPQAPGSTVVEVPNLPCRPCNLHGLPACPQGHFNCAQHIDPLVVVATL